MVLDFWNTESEVYDAGVGKFFSCIIVHAHDLDRALCHAVKLTICRESYSDYEAAARLINKEYDMALLNFKLGKDTRAVQNTTLKA